MKENVKRFLIYFSYTILIFVLYYIGQRIILNYNIQFQSTFDFKPVMIARIMIPISIGLFLALPKFVYELRREGRWKYDWVKLLAIGVPTSYITFMPIFSFIQVPFLSNIVYFFSSIPAAPHILHYSIAGYAVGYILITSFYKTSNEKTT